MREQQCITCEKDCVYCDGSSNACPQCGMDCPRCESVRECPNCEKECVYCNDVDDGICTSCKRECFFCKNALDNNGGGCEICRMWCVPTDDGPSTCLCTMRRCGACNTVFHLQDKQLCDAECICSAVFCPACITRNIYVGRRFADGASGDRSAAQDRRWRGPVLECSLCTTVRNRRITTDEQLLEAACKRLRVTRAELAQLSLDDQLPHDPITKQRQRERARRRAAKRKLDARS